MSALAGLRRAGLRLRAYDVTCIARAGVGAVAVPLRGLALSLPSECSTSARDVGMFGGLRALHSTPAAWSGGHMSEGAFTTLVDNCLEDLYCNLEVPSAPRRLLPSPQA